MWYFVIDGSNNNKFFHLGKNANYGPLISLFGGYVKRKGFQLTCISIYLSKVADGNIFPPIIFLATIIEHLPPSIFSIWIIYLHVSRKLLAHANSNYFLFLLYFHLFYSLKKCKFLIFYLHTWFYNKLLKNNLP